MRKRDLKLASEVAAGAIPDQHWIWGMLEGCINALKVGPGWRGRTPALGPLGRWRLRVTANHLVTHGLMRQRLADGFNLIRRDFNIVDPGRVYEDAPRFDLGWPRAFMALSVHVRGMWCLKKGRMERNRKSIIRVSTNERFLWCRAQQDVRY